MTYALIEAVRRVVADEVEKFRPDQTHSVNPVATAVLIVFFWKLQARPETQEIPLEALVTPESLPAWRALFVDRVQLETFVAELRPLGVHSPGVQPQPDGSLVIPLPWLHPDQDEDLVTPRDALLPPRRVARLQLVHAPDDWRVQGIEPQDGS